MRSRVFFVAVKVLFLLQSIMLIGFANASESVWEISRLAGNNEARSRLIKNDGSAYQMIESADARSILDVTNKLAILSGINPKVLIADSSEINAFAFWINGEPYIKINYALYANIAKDKDMAAGLIGHEIAHLYFRHSESKKGAAVAASILGMIAGVALEILIQRRIGVANLGLNLGSVGKTTLVTAYSREAESEADQKGVEWAISSGFQPEGQLRLLQLLERTNTQQGGFFATHPSTDERITLVRNYIAQATADKNLVALKTASTITPRMASLYEAVNKDQQSQIPASQEGVDGLRAFLQKDWQTAKTNFEKCTERAEGVCLNNLGVIFENGLGVVSDKQKAFEYYKRAADSGLTLGVYNYGRALILSFNGTTANPQKGISLYKQAAEAGSPQAMGMLAQLSQTDATGLLLTSANITDKELLYDYAKVSNAFGNQAGMLALGYMYLNGYSGAEKNQELAKLNFEKAANFGNAGGFIALGKMASENANQIEADNYFERAFKISPIATSTLFGYYGVKDSPAYDLQKAAHWAKKGAYAGVTGAMVPYGIYLSKGMGGLAANETEGSAWIYVAKSRGSKIANDLVEKNWSSLSQTEKDAILAKAKDISESIPNSLGIVAAPN